MATLFLPLSGVDPTNPTPGNYIEVRFAVGDAGGAANPKKALILAPSLASGDIVQDTQVYGPVTDEDDVIARTGNGSAAHLAWQAFKENGGNVPTYLLCPTRSAGVAATGTFVVSGTPTGAGTVTVTVAGQQAYYTFGLSDTATTIAAGLVAAINQLRRCPVTAGNSTGTVTLTAKQAGLSGNSIRYRTSTTGAGVSVTVTAEAALTGGTVAENHTNALATIAAQRWNLIVCATNDATEMARIMTHVDTLALPSTGLRQFAVFGLVLTPAAAATAVQGLNRARGMWPSQEESPEPNYMLAGKVAGVLAATYFANPSANLDGYGTKDGQVFTVKRPFNDSAIPTASELTVMLSSGVTPIGVTPSGQAYVVRAVTGRSLNGAVPDFRVRDAHRVFVADALADDILAKLSTMPWEALTDDPAVANAQQPPAKFATPSRGKAAVEPLIVDYTAVRGHLDPARLAYSIANLQAGIDPSNPGALNLRVPAYACNLLHRTATLVAEQSPNA